MVQKSLLDKLQIREGTFVHTMRIYNPITHSYGDTYFDTQTSYVNLATHETIENIIATIIHEDLHVALKREDLNDDIEHHIIKLLFWHMEDLY